MSRKGRTFRLEVESLEQRLLLCADHAFGGMAGEPAVGTFPAVESDSGGGDPTAAGGTKHALDSVPALNSFPGAAVSLYLDFNGDFTANWGGQTNITTPAFDQDGDATTFTDAELSAIEQIWRYVAEDYAPFNVNVTTVEPPNFDNGVALRVDIGGNGSWAGGLYGGIAYVDSFTSSIVNTVYVFPKNLGNGNPKFVGDASGHESGHGFGLQHQSLYRGSSKIAEYYSGSGDGRAPLMGNSYHATRSLWWKGQSTLSASTIQDDMAVISRAANRFSYRTDDHGNNMADATPLTLDDDQVSGAGLIEQTSDVDYFSFEAGAGALDLFVNVPAPYNNLDATLELRDSAGDLIASADPSDSFGAEISATVDGGTYYLVVGSHGSYGDVGQYTVSGAIVLPSNGINTPTNLTGVANGNQVDLTWHDHADNETGYTVQRSLDGGSTWDELVSLPADSNSYSDTDVTAGGSYRYRIQAFNDVGASYFSNKFSITLAPDSPVDLAAIALSAGRIRVTWNDVSGEAGYLIERSGDGSQWETVGTTAADQTNFEDLGRNPTSTYFYRVTAFNAGGNSSPSDPASATTPSLPPPPAAPSGLTGAWDSANGRIALHWTDNSSNEVNFVIQRSVNGGKYKQIGLTPADTISLVDTGFLRGKIYRYRVRAINEGGDSIFSNKAKVSTRTRRSASDNPVQNKVALVAGSGLQGAHDAFSRASFELAFTFSHFFGGNVAVPSAPGKSALDPTQSTAVSFSASPSLNAGFMEDLGLDFYVARIRSR